MLAFFDRVRSKSKSSEIAETISTDADVAPIVLWDKKGEYTPISTEELIASKLNKFEGWTCTAGQAGIFINFDGLVFRGTREVGGSFGNIYEDFDFPDSNIICSAKFCMCGGDIMMPKYRTAEMTRVALRSVRSHDRNFDPIAVTGAEPARGMPVSKRVVWSIGRRCNYDCTYCSPLVHSNKEALKTKERLMLAAKRLNEKFCRGSKTTFYIAGGEPTLYPGLIETAKYLKEAGHECVVISNGSAPTRIYQELIKYSHVCLSAHFEFLRENVFVTNIRAIVAQLEQTLLDGHPLYHRIDIKLMTPPGSFEIAQKLLSQILDIDHFQYHGTARFNALWLPTDIETLADYSTEELKRFEILNNDSYQLEHFQPKRDRPPRSQPPHFVFKSGFLGRIVSHRISGRIIHVIVHIWLAIYWSRILRKPYYFVRFQVRKHFKF